MNRKDQIKTQVREALENSISESAIEHLPDMIGHVFQHAPGDLVYAAKNLYHGAQSALPALKQLTNPLPLLAVTSLGLRGVGKLMGSKKAKPPSTLGPRTSKIREIPGILTTRQRS
jgi:hypothetical protein